jgi:hypothetical protein
LSVKTGEPPRSGRARFRPPPVSSRSGSWEIVTSGALRREVGRDLVGMGVGVDDDARRADRARDGEGVVEERAAGDRQERLRPVGGQRAHARAEAGGEDHDGVGHAASRADRAEQERARPAAPRCGRGWPGPARAGRRTRRAAAPARDGRGRAQVVPDPREVAQVAGLAVAAAEAGEDAEDLEVALGGEDGGGGGEGLRVGAGGGAVAGGHGRAQPGRCVAARVLQQRDEVVGRMADQHVLVVEQADAGVAGAGGSQIRFSAW